MANYDKTVEAVARALCILDGSNPDVHTVNRDQEDILYWTLYIPQALVAIKAHNECLMERFQKDADDLRSVAAAQQWRNEDKQRFMEVTDAAVEYAQSTIQDMFSISMEKTDV